MSLFLTTPKEYCMWIKTSWETNHEIKTNIFTCFWYWCWKNLFFNVKLKLLMNNFNFSQFHEHIFRSRRSQMFSKIGAPKNFTIFSIKQRPQNKCFSVCHKNIAKFLKEQFFYRTPRVAASIFFFKVITQLFRNLVITY